MFESDNPIHDSMPPAAPAADDDYDVTAAEKTLVAKWLSEIRKDIEFHKPAFERQEKWNKFAKGIQWPGQTENDDRYVADITQRIVRNRVASLYAKNPTVVARRAERMDFSLWDERMESAMAAMQNPQDPYNMMLLQDIAQGVQHRDRLDRMCRTLEVVIRHTIREQQPVFKREMKRMLRRQEIRGVGWIKLDYVRDMEIKPDIEAQIGDMANRLAAIRAMVESQIEGATQDQELEIERITIAMDSLREQQYVLKREGIVFAWPRSDAIIPCRTCTQLEGFLNAPYVSERFNLTDETIKKIYNINVNDYSDGSDRNGAGGGKDWRLMDHRGPDKKLGRENTRAVYLVFNRDDGTEFVIAEGCCRFLKKPSAPIIITEQFYPWYPIAFNETEDMESIWPRSTVALMIHQQMEYNRSKEALRQHRIASRPLYVSGTGALSDEDKRNIAEHEAHDCIELSNLGEGQSVESKFGMVKKYPIDPNVYETRGIETDITLVVGTQPANLGGIAGGTATETSVAEDSRQSDISSNADDQDDVLSIVFREVGHNALFLMDADYVRKIAGRGAVWPDIPDEDIIRDIYVDIEAGSSGRPNRAAQAAAWQRLAPFVLQTPGISPSWVARRLVSIVDDSADLTDAYVDGLPSIQMLNRVAAGPGQNGPAPGAGPLPEDQAAEGMDNGIRTPGAAAPALPAMPSGDVAAAQRGGGILSQIRGMLGR